MSDQFLMILLQVASGIGGIAVGCAGLMIYWWWKDRK